MKLTAAAIESFYGAGDVASIASGFEPFAAAFSLETTGLAGAFIKVRSADTCASINHFGGSAFASGRVRRRPAKN